MKLTAKWKPLAIGLGSAVVLLLVFSFAPIMRVSYVVEEMYGATEEYYVRESYTAQEPYTVMEPYEEYVPIDYSITGEEGLNYYGGLGCMVEVYIKNTDVIGGTFTVEFHLILLAGTTITIAGSKYIEAGNTERVVASYEGAPLRTPHSFTYSVTAPTKTITAYREVIKYRETTKYRFVPTEVTVLKTRMVTRHKMVSLLKYLISY